MKTFSISLNDTLAEAVLEQMKKQKHSNRSEFFRELVREKYFPNTSEIKEISMQSEDYKHIQKRRETPEYIPFDNILKEHNV